MSQPGRIDGFQFARSGSRLSGRIESAQLPRLAGSQATCDGLAYDLQGGESRSGKPGFRLWVEGALILVCQRCMGPLEFPVEIDVELELAGTREEIEQADDEIDRVLASREMEVAELVEDEVMLALPMAPRHEACGPSQAAKNSGRVSPFGALAGLKRGLGH